MKTKTYDFPLLHADDIECRIGQVGKNGKATLLLYQNARVGMRLLDEVVGQTNWQRTHYELKGHIYCSIQLWDNEKQQWITKSDVGSESQVEIEKGESSDSFKRACVNVGIGRELYTAPTIWVEYDKDNDRYAKFEVVEIGYNDKGEINKLVIEKNGEVAYTFPKSRQQAQPKLQPKTIKVEDIKVGDTFGLNNLSTERASLTTEQSKYIQSYASMLTNDNQRTRFFTWLENKCGTSSITMLSEQQADSVIKALDKKGGNQ